MECMRFGRVGLLVALLLLLMMQGCIEHRFFYKFNVDGVCDFYYSARGDSLDIYDPAGSFPTEPLFTVNSWTEVDSAGTETHVLEAQGRFNPDDLPGTLGLKEIPWTDVFLKHPSRLYRTPLFFASIYKFQATFQSRERTATEGERWDHIPEECRVLESDEDTTLTDEERSILEEKYAAGMLLWNAERYKLRVREILQQALELNAKTNIPPDWVDSALTEVDSLIDAYLAAIKVEELDLANLEWWDDLAVGTNQILFENLNFIGDSTLQADIAHIGELLEMRHRVTEDLMDESFIIRVDLPGHTINANTKESDEGVLVWRFDGNDLADDNYVIRAYSFYVFGDRVIGALVLSLAIFLAVKLRRPGEKKESVEPPPPSQDSIPPTGHG